jgi:RNA recognition motif-containing protein
MYQLFIVGLPRDMNESELLELISAYGSVDDLKIIRDKETRQSKGYGFITLSDRSAAERVIQNLNNAMIDDRTLTVRYADLGKDHRKQGRLPGR